MRARLRCLLLTALVAASPGAVAGAQVRLGSGEIDDIARLLMLEDRRELDDTALTRMVRSAHPEIRRRATLAVGRIGDARGRLLLAAGRNDPDTAVRATVAFATGQLADSAAVAWLNSLLTEAGTASGTAREAARSLGKIRTAESHGALAAYLMSAQATARTSDVIGEALLSIGRFTTRGDLAPILRWTTSADTAIGWRATWALMRPRDPAAIGHLLRLSEDRSPEVRFWAVRGLVAVLADSARIDRERTSARLRAATTDPDRRVRTEALRALASYDDDASFEAVLAALDSDDSWIAVSAGESLGRFRGRASVVVPRLVAASRAGRPRALRIAVLQPLVALAPDVARELANALMLDSSATARQAATQALRALGPQRAAASDSGRAGGAGRGRGAGAEGGQARPASTAAARTLADYRRIVDRWVVPDYNGAPTPRVQWDTPRGTIELELYPADAPLAVDYLMQLMDSSAIVGTEFGRVVPNFVAQQRTIAGAVTLRDEVNRRGLTRGNLSWASAGLDTGRPGYTLGSTVQPHNEGGFTALGRVVRGMEVVDRLELGDAVLRTRVVK